MRSAECGIVAWVRVPSSIPHSAFRIPHWSRGFTAAISATTMMLMRDARLILVLGLAILLTAPIVAVAKERHFEQLRTVLISRAARCKTCHLEADGTGFNAYGDRLKSLSPDDSLGDRIAAMDADPPVGASEAEQAERRRDQDVDQDGVPNWVEILAGSNPGDSEDRPRKKRAKRVERVIGCTLCHEANHLLGKQGLEANPHNEHGRLLAGTFILPRSRRQPKTRDAILAAAERTPILKRLGKIRKKRPPKSKATYWQQIRLLHDPIDPEDKPTPKRLKAFKKRAALQRSRRKRDPTRGLDCEAHPLDGFLLDAKDLD